MASPDKTFCRQRSEDYENTKLSSISEGGYEYEFLGVPDSRYECPICLHCLRDPVLTACGHRFCSGCISQWVPREGKCPVDAVPLSIENIFPDNYTRREIMQSLAKCPNSKRGCNITMTVSELERHVNFCCYAEGYLPDGACGEGNESENAQDCAQQCSNGKQRASPKREVYVRMTECVYKDIGCAAMFPAHEQENHLKNDVHHHLQLLSSAYKRLKVHSSRSSLLEADCHRSPEQELDDYNFRRQRSWDSVRFARRFKQGYKDSFNQKLLESEEACSSKQKCEQDAYEADSNVKGNSSTFLGAGELSPSERQKIQFQDMFKRLVQLEQSDIKKDTVIENLKRCLLEAENLNRALTSSVQEIQSKSCFGVFVWRIPNFQSISLSMRQQQNSFLNSPGFYTSSCGYKLNIRFNLFSAIPVSNRDKNYYECPLEQDEHTFMSLYVHFMQGDYDDTLQWPFQGGLKITLIHPSITEDSISEFISSNRSSSAFERPTLPTNPKGIGYPEFCTINKIFSQGFLKNNALTLKVVARCHDESHIFSQ